MHNLGVQADVAKRVKQFVKSKRTVKRNCSEIIKLLILYNKNLKSNLQMLDYIASLEAGMTLNLKTEHCADVKKMKTKLQQETIVLTEKIQQLNNM
ncbi:hypothetical protein [Neotamlana nanhaiensis]|nr:hypothetical protein [Tamlana nanhaiensis]